MDDADHSEKARSARNGADDEPSGREWKGAMGSHIGGDFLLVRAVDDDFVEFVRLGSHSELFGR
ncbi:type II toxin-antitoxin system YafQ family toxin [Mesorhizobium kowhaii]|uniref:type II toxin-antitoxin system YafQ family toxin n=1 Tax=Mesorhizobium kowhaii TaxID=1300272 RepID=UPI0035E51BC5